MSARAHHAFSGGYNTIDLSRRSLSYELRLAKYASRGFAVSVTGFDHSRVDPNLFDKPFYMLRGLSKLIVLDKLRTPLDRLQYQERQRTKNNKPRLEHKFRNRKLLEQIEKLGGDLSEYSTVFLPWGAGFDAVMTMRMMKKKDNALNGEWFAKDRPYYLHPCFYGTMAEVIRDCSPDDPPIPDSVPIEKIRRFVRGPLTWLEDDPGRQDIGSFHPVTTDDWENGAYFHQSIGDLFVAINANDTESLVEAVRAFDSDEEFTYIRDFLGRPPLHFAILAGAEECALALIDMGHDSMLTLKLPDGKSVLHLCSLYDMPQVAKALLKRVAGIETMNVEDFVLTQDNDVKMDAFAFAVRMGNMEMIKLLLPFVKKEYQVVMQVDHLEATLMSPLLLVSNSSTASEVLDCLFDHGMFNQQAAICESFNNLFHLLARKSHVELARMILERAHARDEKLMRTLLKMLNTGLCNPITVAIESFLGGKCTMETIELFHQYESEIFPSESVCDNTRLMVSKLADRTSYRFRKLSEVTRESVMSPLLRVLSYAFTWLGSNTNFKRDESFDVVNEKMSLCFDCFKWVLAREEGLKDFKQAPEQFGGSYRLTSLGKVTPVELVELYVQNQKVSNTNDYTAWEQCISIAREESNSSYDQALFDDTLAVAKVSNRFNERKDPQCIEFFAHEFSSLLTSTTEYELKLYARNFIPPSDVTAESVRFVKVGIPSNFTLLGNLLGKDHSEQALRLFQCIFEVNNVDELLKAAKSFPAMSVENAIGVNLVGQLGKSFIGERRTNTELLQVLLDRANFEYRPPQERAPTKQGFIDNYQLMDSSECDSSGNSTDEEEEESHQVNNTLNAFEMKPWTSTVHCKEIVTKSFVVRGSVLSPIDTRLTIEDEKLYEMDILEVAVLLDDSAMIKMLLEIASTWEADLNYAETWVQSVFNLAMVLDRKDVIKAFVDCRCFGVSWSAVARSQNVELLQLKASEKTKYTGMSTNMEGSRLVPMSPATIFVSWLHKAAYFGAVEVFSWIKNQILKDGTLFKNVLESPTPIGMLLKDLASKIDLISCICGGMDNVPGHRSLVYYAVSGGSTTILDLLDNPNYLEPCDQNNFPLMLALKCGRKEMLQYLITKIPASTVDPLSGNNILMQALVNKQKELALMVAEIVSDEDLQLMISCPNNERINALMQSCSINDVKFVEGLFKQYLARDLFEARDCNGRTLLHHVLKPGKKERHVMYLDFIGRHDYFIEDLAGSTPLDMELNFQAKNVDEWETMHPFIGDAETRVRETALFAQVQEFVLSNFNPSVSNLSQNRYSETLSKTSMLQRTKYVGKQLLDCKKEFRLNKY